MGIKVRGGEKAWKRMQAATGYVCSYAGGVRTRTDRPG